MSGFVARSAIRAEPLDAAAIEASVVERTDGALVTFRGVIRDHDGGHGVERLEYSAHPDASDYLRVCCQRIAAETDLSVAAEHRIGRLEIGDVALVAVVAAAHRAEAFAACAALVDDIKTSVPIWKRQYRPDGTSEWVGL